MSLKPEIISLREFARRMSIGEKTIRDAIKVGKIEKGITLVNDKPRIIFHLAKVEFEQMNIGAKAKYGIETEIISEPLTSDGEGDDYLDGSAPIALAQRMKAIAEANIKLREDAVLSKTLIRVEDLSVQLNELMSSIRKELETIPQRASGKIHAILGGDLIKITEILTREVNTSLLRVNNECSINKVVINEDSKH